MGLFKGGFNSDTFFFDSMFLGLEKTPEKTDNLSLVELTSILTGEAKFFSRNLICSYCTCVNSFCAQN